MSRRNPMADPVREVRLMSDTGKVLRILSNDLDARAEEIAQLYKRRWAIELFFRWVKQTLKITRCFNISPRMPCTSRSLLPSSPFCSCASPKRNQKQHPKPAHLRQARAGQSYAPQALLATAYFCPNLFNDPTRGQYGPSNGPRS